MQCPFYLIPLKLCIIEEIDEERDPLFEIILCSDLNTRHIKTLRTFTNHPVPTDIQSQRKERYRDKYAA